MHHVQCTSDSCQQAYRLHSSTSPMQVPSAFCKQLPAVGTSHTCQAASMDRRCHPLGVASYWQSLEGQIVCPLSPKLTKFSNARKRLSDPRTVSPCANAGCRPADGCTPTLPQLLACSAALACFETNQLSHITATAQMQRISSGPPRWKIKTSTHAIDTNSFRRYPADSQPTLQWPASNRAKV